MEPMRAARLLTPGSAWPVQRARAVDLARAEASKRGLPWDEPVRAYRHYGNWAVRTRIMDRGGNVQVIIDAGSGEVLDVSGPTPR